MRDSEPLRDYVNLQKREGGRRQSQGEFTLDRSTALEKLARYSLPFEGAWAVKVVQAVVASGSRGSLKIHQTRRKTRFAFGRAEEWNFERISDQFTDPRKGPDRSLYHLAQAFWAVLAAGEGEFRMLLEGLPGQLVWDQELHYREGPVADSSVVEVRHRRDGGLFERAVVESQSNVLKALSSRCFFCPMPLTLDGRRLDALQRCPHHGWEGRHEAVMMAVGEADCPLLELPPATFERADEPSHWLYQLEYPKTRQAALVCQMSYHPTSAPPSSVHWVADGAVICSEPLPVRQSSCSLGLYLSAEGLVTDATTFNLIDQLPKDERVLAAARAASIVLSEIQHLEPDRHRKLFKELRGGLLGLAVGTGLVLFSKFVGAYFIGFTVLMTLKEAGEPSRVKPAVDELIANWNQRYPCSDRGTA